MPVLGDRHPPFWVIAMRRFVRSRWSEIRTKRPLEPHATAKQALLAIAALGGHIKNNGPPGWQVLARGYHHLLLLEIGWIAREKCDR